MAKAALDLQFNGSGLCRWGRARAAVFEDSVPFAGGDAN
jgi:hypothetical protein